MPPISLPNASVALALNCCCCVATTLWLLGETVTPSSGPGTRVIGAVVDLVMEPWVTSTVTACSKVPAVGPAVKLPSLNTCPASRLALNT